MSNLLDIESLMKILDKEFGTDSTNLQYSHPEDFIKITRLAYPNIPREFFRSEVFLTVTTLGKKHQYGVISKANQNRTHIQKVFADSDLEVLKYCADRSRELYIVFDVETKKTLYCPKEYSEPELRKFFIDDWDRFWNSPCEELNIPTSIFIE